MKDKFWRNTMIWGLVIVTIWVGDKVVRDVFFTADSPRAITPRGSLSEFEASTVEIFENVAPTVAYIFTESVQSTFFGGERAQSGAGSGFVWDRAGHVVTNFHVIEGAGTVLVRLDESDPISATVVGVAPDYDLAVLRLSQMPTGLQPIPVGTSSDLKVGQFVLAIGNPFGLSRTLTTGIISALNRRLDTAPGREVVGVIQTDAAINPGNSGGPLIDSAGRLIGVNTAIISGSGSSAGIGFAVPVDQVNRIVPDLIAHGKAPRPGIGIQVASEEQAARAGIDGIIVVDVMPGGSADKAGLMGVDRNRGVLGDVITHAEGKRVRTLTDLAEVLERIGVGGKIRLTVSRDGQLRDVTMSVMDIS